MLNNVTFMGRLVENPELRTTKNDIPVTSFRLACSRDYVSSGDKRESDFVDVDAWRSQAEFACKYFKKGQLMVVTGRLKNKQWTDKHEQKRTDTVIEADNIYFADSKTKDDGKDEIDPFAGSVSAPQAPEALPQATSQFPTSPWG